MQLFYKDFFLWLADDDTKVAIESYAAKARAIEWLISLPILTAMTVRGIVVQNDDCEFEEKSELKKKLANMKKAK